MAEESQEYTGQPAAPETEKEKPKGDPRQGLPASVRVETGAPLELKQADPNAKGPWIQYNGVGSVRIMTEEDWKNVGVDSDQYAEWNYLNQKRLPRSHFSDEELQYLLNVDGRFSLVEDDKKTETTK